MALKMGLGKSLAAITVAVESNLPTLIICPSSLIYNWKRELEKWLDSPMITIIKKGADIYPVFDADFVIISYDLSQKADCIFEWAQCVICDEANHLSHMNTKRTAALHKLIYENGAERLLLLTGTPIKNRVEEYFSLIALCNYNPKLKDPKFLKEYPDSITFADQFSFRHEFQKPIWTGGYRKYITIKKWEGLRNEDELKDWLKPIYISRQKASQALLRKDVWLEDFDDKDLLDAFNKAIEEEVGSSVMSNAKAASALRKCALTVKYIKDLLSADEIDSAVIFTDHVESCHSLAESFGVEGITGQMNPKRRQELAERFQNKEDQVIVATIKSFSTGHNLTRANNLFFNDYSWVPGDQDQAEHRINRLGQARQCIIHRIIASKQDKYIIDTLDKKSKVIAKLV